MVCCNNSKFLYIADNQGNLLNLSIEKQTVTKDFGLIWDKGSIDHLVLTGNNNYLFVANSNGN